MNDDILKTLVRLAVKYLAGVLAAHGILDADSLTQTGLELLTSAVMVLVGLKWSFVHQDAIKSDTKDATTAELVKKFNVPTK